MAVLPDAINSWVEGELAIKLTAEALAETHVGAFPAILNWGPIEAAPTIVLRNVRTLTEDVDFIWAETAQLWPLLDLGTGVWEISYTGGYAVVPDGLQAAIDQVAADMVAGAGVVSERLGDYSYTMIGDYAQRHMKLLLTYRRLFA